MAYNNILGQGEAYVAGADLTAKQYTFVTAGANDVVTATGDGAAATGVLWNAPAQGKAATVIRGGEPHVYAGAAIAVNAEIASDANGKAVTATSGDVVVGRARHAVGAANQLVMITFYGKAQYTKA